MGIWKGASCLVFLGLLMHTRGQGDFDLADALDDPGPTKKPNSDIYPKPKPPYHPQPGSPDNSGNIYPRPKPPSRPLPGNFDNSGGYGNNIDHHGGGYPPRPRPPAGGGGYHPSYDADGNSQGGRGRYRPNSGYGGGGGHSTYGNPQGNTIAKIVSPIVSVVVVALVGAAVRHFTNNRRRNCFSSNEPQNV
ncbi:glycoprotein Xg-like isoform X6 [Dasypus novemcinctus]|uniref:glycoprotein Xg isoform X7 n=1 Tax=Dasypus novemcinctus TaxID=9361 RepID=UPI000328BEDB|nr:glycoprotein Xg isoform X7 [Dasypus novemcinctus]